MLFNSYAFAFFFPCVTIVYFLLPASRRWLWLLLASCLFYCAAIPEYLLILFVLVLIDYSAALAIERVQGARRTCLLALSLVANLGLLGVFKYYNLIVETLAWSLSLAHLHWIPHRMPWPLPIGLSFHTFQAMSYTIEVYRGRCQAERHLGIYALYVLFYPQLVAGPIERPQHLLPQLRLAHSFDYVRVVRGLQLMAWGMFKKAAVADRLALIVNPVYANPMACQGPALALAAVYFSVQIYCDFSGYSDIAIGAAEVMGFDLVSNFRRPYFACTLGEFWKRWHISLSTWFRDYVYLPLGGNRGSAGRVAVNVLIVFGLSGIWHGARWTFLLWGLIHGTALLLQRRVLGEQPAPGLPRWLGRWTTVAVVTLAWIPFRAESWSAFSSILTRLPLGWPQIGQGPWFSVVNLQTFEYVGTAVALAMLGLVEICQERGLDRAWVARQPPLVRWALYYALVGGIVLLATDQLQSFLYFQF